jgi:ABC-type amino acid transport substrate-binding protein
MKKLIFALVLMTSAVTMLAQESTYQGVIDHFFTTYKNDGPEKAIDYIFSTNPYLESNTEQVTTIKLKLATAVAVIGDYYGFDPVIVKELGPSMTVGTYMVRYKRQPIFFTFILYKPDKIWQIQTLRFDDKIEALQMSEFDNVAGEK